MRVGLPLLPDDYHKEIAHELIDFFHNFYGSSIPSINRFDLENRAYTDTFQSIIFCCMGIGTIVFLLLCILVMRRCFLHTTKYGVYSHRWMEKTYAMEVSVAILLSFLAISALGGLMGEAQVDYSAGVVKDTMMNISYRFGSLHKDVDSAVNSSIDLRQHADRLITSFNATDLPSEAFQLSLEALRLVHAANDVVDVMNDVPKNISRMAETWEKSYFMVQGTTNFVILSVVFATLLSVASIGWSMLSPLRLSVLLMMTLVPISHTLIGLYFSSTLLTADFCAYPVENSLALFHNTTVSDYFLICENSTQPFAETTSNLVKSLENVASIESSLSEYAKNHNRTGSVMLKEFLYPMEKMIHQVKEDIHSFTQNQECHTIASQRTHAVAAFCDYGITGLFSMWIHQIILCVFLFIGVALTVLIYERVQWRELSLHQNYQLLSTYEEDNTEHIYLSSD